MAGMFERVFEELEHFSKDQMEDVAEALRSQIDWVFIKIWQYGQHRAVRTPLSEIS